MDMLLPCPDYCKYCCNEHWGVFIFLNNSFLWIYAQEWDCWIIWKLVLVFKGTFIIFSIIVVPIYIPTSSVGGFLFLHTLSSIYYL